MSRQEYRFKRIRCKTWCVRCSCACARAEERLTVMGGEIKKKKTRANELQRWPIVMARSCSTYTPDKWILVKFFLVEIPRTSRKSIRGGDKRAITTDEQSTCTPYIARARFVGIPLFLERIEDVLPHQAQVIYIHWFLNCQPEVVSRSGGGAYLPVSFQLIHRRCASCDLPYNPVSRSWDDQKKNRLAQGFAAPVVSLKFLNHRQNWI